MLKKAVGYIRRGKKHDEERQRKAIEGYCLAHDMAVTEWFDGGEAFGDVVYGSWMRNRVIDAVVVASGVDVACSVYEFYAYRYKLRMRNSELIAVDGGSFAGYGLYGKLFDELVDTMVRVELEHAPIRIATGRMHKVAKGGYIGGQPPMGYKVEGGKLVVNPDEVAVVELIMERKHAGKTMSGTVEELNAKGYKTRKGGPFVISTVQSIWNNEMLYKGYTQYKGSGNWVKGEHEAIIKE